MDPFVAVGILEDLPGRPRARELRRCCGVGQMVSWHPEVHPGRARPRRVPDDLPMLVRGVDERPGNPERFQARVEGFEKLKSMKSHEPRVNIAIARALEVAAQPLARRQCPNYIDEVFRLSDWVFLGVEEVIPDHHREVWAVGPETLPVPLELIVDGMRSLRGLGREKCGPAGSEGLPVANGPVVRHIRTPRHLRDVYYYPPFGVRERANSPYCSPLTVIAIRESGVEPPVGITRASCDNAQAAPAPANGASVMSAAPRYT